jgi:2-oxoisovalerate dehydrogenase E2 component (dihydrolipoyl transacylase)
MSSLSTNMIIHLTTGFVRTTASTARTNSATRSIFNSCSKRGLSSIASLTSSSSSMFSLDTVFLDRSPQNYLLMYQTSTKKCSNDWHRCYSNNLSNQRRFRSALPEDYYEDTDDDEYGDDDDPNASTNDNTDSSTGSADMNTGANTGATPFLLADIGEGIAEVELMRWFVKEGQMIQEFDPVCEVQSDKATVEITSRYEGQVSKLRYEIGNVIKVGTPILWIHESDQQDGEEQEPLIVSLSTKATTRTASSSSSSSSSASQDGSSDTQMRTSSASIDVDAARLQQVADNSSTNFAGTPHTNTSSKKVLTSPAVRKLAKENSIDLCSITGSGPAGRICKGDVLAILKDSITDNSNTVSINNEIDTNSTKIDEKHPNTMSSSPSSRTGDMLLPIQEDTIVSLRGYNRIMANTMTASLKIPHMVYSDEINLNRFVRYKMEQQLLLVDDPCSQNNADRRLLFLPLAIKAASKALEHYPWLNSSYDETKQEVSLWKDHNIGIAMDTPRGLIVPVLKRCQEKSLPELTKELKRMKEALLSAEGGGLPAVDLQGATFTLSNVGAIGGGTYMSPVVTPPQVAIGAFGKIRRLPRFVSPSSSDPTTSREIEEVHVCTVSWAADHRVVDGATVARFHGLWKTYMEDPIRLLLELR